ncbi:hypothetical protein [Streptomyces aureus]|uniref:hypothetical protein n=1 Tax=Streptomyces aureus TaxID=193461 RepID=UPI00369D01C2
MVLITGTSRQLGGDRRGHYGPDFWVVPEDSKGRRASELFVAGELIALGGRSVMKTLIHEASHGVAHMRGIKDTSGDGNRYHNKRFVAIAEELGLQSPAEPLKTYGWTAITLPDTTAVRYADVIARLDGARLPYLGAPAPVTPGGDGEDQDDDGSAGGDEEEKPKKKRRAGKRFAIVCQWTTTLFKFRLERPAWRLGHDRDWACLGRAERKAAPRPPAGTSTQVGTLSTAPRGQREQHPAQPTDLPHVPGGASDWAREQHAARVAAPAPAIRHASELPHGSHP